MMIEPGWYELRIIYTDNSNSVCVDYQSIYCKDYDVLKRKFKSIEDDLTDRGGNNIKIQHKYAKEQ